MLVAIAVALPVLLGMTGLAVDMGRMYTAKARLQAAVDAAALAGSMYLGSDPQIKNGIVANAAAEYLSNNYPGAVLTQLSPLTQVRGVCVSAEANVPMTFMNVLAIKTRSVNARSCAGFNDLEVVLVVDNSGSMNGRPIAEVKQAANKLVDLMIPDGGAPSIKVGLVPFRGKVRLPEGVDGQPAGCRNANGSVNNSNVNPPDYSCRDAALPPVFGLSYNKSSIKRAINTMNAGNSSSDTSGTIIAEGLKWARHVLTPEAPFVEGGSKDRFRKVIILLTDGDNEDGTCSGAFGGRSPRTDPHSTYRRNAYFQMGVTNCGCNDYGCLDQAMLEEARKAKEEGIEIFAIRFGVSDAVDIALMKAVASSSAGTDDHYYDAPSVNDIGTVFNRIGRQLGFRLL